jgi:hypothetical protein
VEVAILGQLIPIISIVLGILMVIAIVISKHWRDVRELELRHRERMAAIEKGLDLPPETPLSQSSDSVDRPSSPRAGSRYLLRGLVWLGVGLAVALVEAEPANRLHSFGWIAAAVGAAYLIYYFVDARHASVPSVNRDPPPPGAGP